MSRAGALPLDRLDARTRILMVLTIIPTLLSLQSPHLLAGALVLCAGGAIGIAGLRALVRRLLHLEAFLIVLMVMMPLTVPGPAMLEIGPLTVSQPGLERAGLLVLRVNATAMVLFALLVGLEPVRFGHALARLGMPPKLVHLLLFTSRWIALVRREMQQLQDALKARAFRPTTSRHGLRSLAHVTGHALVRAVSRAERVDEAMRCRAFAGHFALIDPSRFGRWDALCAALVPLALGLVIVMDHGL